MRIVTTDTLGNAFYTMFSQMWFVFVILFIIVVFKTNLFKGVVGEFLVNTWLTLRLSKEDYTLIKDVTLPTSDGTTQIDHILLSKFGIFVIETKNMKGWIFGSEKQPKWTQKIYKHSYKFQNPLQQNFKHIVAVSKLFDLNHFDIHSLIVFVGSSTFKTPMPSNVITLPALIDYILSKKSVVYTEQQIKDFKFEINSERRRRGLATNAEHIDYLERKHSKKNSRNGNLRFGHKTRILSSIATTVFFVLVSLACMRYVLNSFTRNVVVAPTPKSVDGSRGGLQENMQRIQKIRQRNLKVQKPTKADKISSDSKALEIKYMKKKEVMNIEILKQNAWKNFFKRSKKCEDFSSDAVMVECANESIRSRRDFEKMWKGKFPESDSKRYEFGENNYIR